MENRTPKMADVPLVSRGGENGVESALEIEMIDSAELAARLKLPESLGAFPLPSADPARRANSLCQVWSLRKVPLAKGFNVSA
jgi:hypothetical protein